VLRNDYDRGLYNGDQGVCLRVVGSGQAESAAHHAAVFARRGGFVSFPVDSLGADLGLAFALTVHKAQGSELDQVGLILPETDLPLLSRELLYTALTRARRAVVIVGSRAVLDAGIARRIERFSGIRDKLLPVVAAVTSR
jgi:exodeoxyribonuclease V alpha subunit